MGAVGLEPTLDRFSYHYSFRYAVVWTMPLPFTESRSQAGAV